MLAQLAETMRELNLSVPGQLYGTVSLTKIQVELFCQNTRPESFVTKVCHILKNYRRVNMLVKIMASVATIVIVMIGSRIVSYSYHTAKDNGTKPSSSHYDDYYLIDFPTQKG